jgi:hypothetical protein
MSNWLENNATPSLVTYTILIVSFTWAVSTFIIEDNRLNLLKAEVDSQKSIAEQYKSKTELLQREIDVVRSENHEYRAWLAQTKDAIPVIVPQIVELKARIAELEKRDAGTNAGDSISGRQEVTVRRGRAYIDAATGLVLTVIRVSVDRQAQLQIKFPGKQVAEEANVFAGAQWKFVRESVTYVLTMTEVSFTGDSIQIQLSPHPR